MRGHLLNRRRQSGSLAHKMTRGDIFNLDCLPTSSPGRTLARVYAALRGEFDVTCLEPDELLLFEDMFIEREMNPKPQNDRFVDKMRAEGGYVGDDIYGRLVRTLAGGGVEILDDNPD